VSEKEEEEKEKFEYLEETQKKVKLFSEKGSQGRNNSNCQNSVGSLRYIKEKEQELEKEGNSLLMQKTIKADKNSKKKDEVREF